MGALGIQKNMIVEDALGTKQEQILDRIGRVVEKNGFSFQAPHKILELVRNSERKIIVTTSKINRKGEEDTYKVAAIPIGHLVENKDVVIEKWEIKAYGTNNAARLEGLAADLAKMFGVETLVELASQKEQKIKKLSGIHKP